MKLLTAIVAAALAVPASAAERPLALPDAPVRLVIPDAEAFDATLAGRWRLALEGEANPSDPVVAAWRRMQVGSKLEEQWSRLSADLPWTWAEIRKLKPRRVGLALLNVGHLEAVLAIETPLAALPVTPPLGEEKQHQGVVYRLIAQGAADGASDERRMGLAWARHGDQLLLATTERALRLSLDAALASAGFEAPLPGLVSVELDLGALREDLYFRREFLFGDGPERGRVRAALRKDGERLVEIREGASDEAATAHRFELSAALGVGWEPEAKGLAAILRGALLEPVPEPAPRPLPALRPLPNAGLDNEDRYLTDLRQPLPGSGPENEEGELRDWRELVSRHTPAGWGWVARRDGRRLVVFEWPEARDGELVELARRTLERRAARAVVARAGDSKELRLGPDLAAAAVRRTGRFLWLGPDAAALADVVEPVAAPELIRWARLDVDRLRDEGPSWNRFEGPASPEEVRPFSDRILGLLGWVPEVKAISVERRRTAVGFEERVTFE